MAHSEGADIKDFFERPIQIATYLWTDLSFSQFLNPWLLWSRNPRVSNRLNNYRNFRGNMCVKVMVNGNQFYWGRMMMSYSPVDSATQEFVFTPNSRRGDMMASQRPHIFIDPSTSEGGTMKLPFFFEDNALNMTANDFVRMGELWLHAIVGLKHATTTNPVDRKSVV